MAKEKLDMRKLEQNTIDFLENHLDKWDKKKKMELGEKYYNQENTLIMNRKKMIPYEIEETGEYVMIEDISRANHKLPSGFLRQQIKQKVNYLINDKMTFTEDSDLIDLVLPKWRKRLKQLSTRVSYQIYGAWQFYIKEDILKYKLIPGDQLIIIFDKDDEEIIDTVIRHYEDSYGNQIAEIWYSDLMIELVKDKKWKMRKVSNHITKKEIVGEEEREIEGDSWGRPPFAILFNNDEMATDLKPIRPAIDVYDITESDFANNIDDFQEVFYELENYQGQDINRFMKQVKQFGTAKVGQGGKINFKQLKIPTEARMTMLKQLRENIFEFGQAVDVNGIAKGQVTNVQIRAMYNNLDLKANDFETELQDFWKQVLYFINKWYELTQNPVNKEASQIKSQLNGELDNELVFDRTLPHNLQEMIKVLTEAAQGRRITSTETLIANNPLVSNAKDELGRIEEENKKEMEAFNIIDTPIE